MAGFLDWLPSWQYLAQLTGQAVPIPGGGGMMVHPNGSIGPPTNTAGVQGLPGSPSGPAVYPPTSVLQRPSQITNRPVGATITAPQLGPVTSPDIGVTDPAARVQYPMNQANPAFTAGIAGAVGTQSGPPVAPTYNLPAAPAAAVARQAAAYRAAQNQGLTTDQLNAQSLAAAQVGRTYLQPGPYPASGNVVANALVAPPGGLYTAPTNLYAGLSAGQPQGPQNLQYASLQGQGVY